MTKVECLKQLLSKMTGEDISTIKGDSICDLLVQITDAYQVGSSGDGGNTESVPSLEGMDVIFARKDVDEYGKFIVGNEDTVSIELIMSDGTIIPADIKFTDVKATS